MFPKTSVTKADTLARLFEYSFSYFLIYLKMKRREKETIGVTMMITSVNFQLISQRKIKLPKNCKIFLTIIDRLSEHTDLMVATSEPSRDNSSPDLVLSQQAMSFVMILSNNYSRIQTMIISPSMLKVQPRMEEKIAMNTVRIMNFMAPQRRSPFNLMVSTIEPQREGSRTIVPEDIRRAMLATIIRCLLFQAYLNSRLNVFLGSFAFFLLFSSSYFSRSLSSRVDRALSQV